MMSKAKELADQLKKHLDVYGAEIRSEYSEALIYSLIDAVLSEPEPFKGWIEQNREGCPRYMLNLITGNKLIEEKNGGLYGCFLWFVEGGGSEYFKESYDSIKQKIRGAS